MKFPTAAFSANFDVENLICLDASPGLIGLLGHDPRGLSMEDLYLHFSQVAISLNHWGNKMTIGERHFIRCLGQSDGEHIFVEWYEVF